MIVCALFEWKLICAEFYRLFICIAVEGSVVEKGGWDPISQFHPAYLCACLRPGTGIPPWYIVVVFIYVRWVQVRGESSFCWYWWNCWPSMFKLSYHNTRNNAIKSIIWRIVWDFIFLEMYQPQNLIRKLVKCSLNPTKEY